MFEEPFRGARALLLGLLATLLGMPGAGPAPGAATVSQELLAAPRWAAVRFIERENRIGLRWNPVSGAEAYRLWRRTGRSVADEPLATVRDLQYFDAEVMPGQTYQYTVQALAGETGGERSEERVVTVPAPAPAPREVIAPRWERTDVGRFERPDAPPAYRIWLHWTPVEGAVGYHVLRTPEGSRPYTPVGFVTVTTYVDESVAEGQTYSYAIVAFGASLAESSPSVERTILVSEKTATVKMGITPAPSPHTATRLWQVTNGVSTAPGAADRVRIAEPFDLAYDGARDRLYVSATSDRHIVVVQASDGAVQGYLGPRIGSAELRLPLGLALDRDGTLYVVDQAEGAVLCVTPEGKLKRRLAVPRERGARPPRLIDAAVLADGRILVTDNANGRVVVMSSEGAVLARWGRRGRAGEEFLGIAAIAATPSGAIAVADGAAGTITLLSSQGKHQSTFGERSAPPGGIAFLGGIAPGRDGRFLASDLWASDLAYLAPAAPVARVRLLAEGGGTPLRLFGPVNLTAGPRDTVFVAEGMANRVTALRLNPPPKAADAAGVRR